MAKKQSTIKKVKKAVKPAKVAKAIKKEKPNKVGKNIKSSSKSSPKVAKKKVVAKKEAKPVKKIAATKPAISKGGKAAKPVKKVVESKKIQKPVVKAGKKVIPQKAAKAEKEIVKKTTVLVIPAKTKVAKPAKPAKKEKVAKKEKPAKAEKSKKERIDEDEDEEAYKKPAKKSKGGRKPKNKNDDDDEPIVENDILIEQLINSTKRLKKPSKVPKQLRTFTNPMASLTVAKLVDSNKKGTFVPKKEPKGKFELEYVLHTSAGILYEFLTSPSGLAEWFADDVNIHDGVFTFFWEGSEQKAKLLGFKDDKFVRLQWLDKPEGTYFEFRIERDELTGDISLIVTDFADEAADQKTSKLLWDSQINQLLHVIGSY
ncbi:MAG: START-like domain-containing protein [Bacteroidota bacterium]